MMFSRFQYPSFKGLNWKTTRSIPRFIAIVLILVLPCSTTIGCPRCIFLAYLLYGFLRPFLSLRMKRGNRGGDPRGRGGDVSRSAEKSEMEINSKFEIRNSKRWNF